MKTNLNFSLLEENYLFQKIANKVSEHQKANPNAEIIRLGIGDVTLPLVPAIVEAMQIALKEMSDEDTFQGYPPANGYYFLLKAISDYYKKFNVEISEDEIFVSDGAKSDTANILDIFSEDNTVLICDPVYPVYLNSAKLRGCKIEIPNATEEKKFLPLPEIETKADLIFLCSPNNPCGSVFNHEQLKIWVDFANRNDAIILFDAAYESFVEGDLPRSIFEIEGAKTCAIEFASFSKNAGMTGVRCAYTVIPKELERNNKKIANLWTQRQGTKFNGVSYVTQKGAAAALSEIGQQQIKGNIKYYKDNAKILVEAFKSMGIWFTGGIHSPYVWIKCPNNMNSWEFFDFLLKEINVVGTPGEGFGENGKGYFRFSSFGKTEQVIKAVERLKNLKFQN